MLHVELIGLQIVILSLVRNSGGSEEDEVYDRHPKGRVNIGFLRVGLSSHACCPHRANSYTFIPVGETKKWCVFFLQYGMNLD